MWVFANNFFLFVKNANNRKIRVAFKIIHFSKNHCTVLIVLLSFSPKKKPKHTKTHLLLLALDIKILHWFLLLTALELVYSYTLARVCGRLFSLSRAQYSYSIANPDCIYTTVVAIDNTFTGTNRRARFHSHHPSPSARWWASANFWRSTFGIFSKNFTSYGKKNHSFAVLSISINVLIN